MKLVLKQIFKTPGTKGHKAVLTWLPASVDTGPRGALHGPWWGPGPPLGCGASYGVTPPPEPHRAGGGSSPGKRGCWANNINRCPHGYQCKVILKPAVPTSDTLKEWQVQS